MDTALPPPTCRELGIPEHEIPFSPTDLEKELPNPLATQTDVNTGGGGGTGVGLCVSTA